MRKGKKWELSGMIRFCIVFLWKLHVHIWQWIPWAWTMLILLATFAQRVKVVVADPYTNMSNRWSCSSLEAGFRHVMGDMLPDDDLRDEEQKLMMEIEAGPDGSYWFITFFVLLAPAPLSWRKFRNSWASRLLRLLQHKPQKFYKPYTSNRS